MIKTDPKRKRDSPDNSKLKHHKMNEQAMQRLLERLEAQNSEILQEMKELKTELLQYKRENEMLRETLAHTNQRLEKMDRWQRRKNLVITGKNFQDGRPAQESIEDFLQKTISVKAKISSVHKVKDTMYIIRMHTVEGRVEILKNKAKLKDTAGRVYIDPDRTQAERELRRRLLERLREEREKGNMVKMRRRGLQIGDREYEWNDSENKLVEVKKNWD